MIRMNHAKQRLKEEKWFGSQFTR